MVKLAWDNIGSVGIEPIDQDHQQMALMVNALAEAMQDGAVDRAKGMAALLAERFETHSLRERRLFVPGGETGDVRHDRIARRIGELRDAVAEGDGMDLLQLIADDLLEEVEDDAVLVKTMCGQALDLAERRRYLRFRVAMEVAARLAQGKGVQPGELVDISRGGCLFVDGKDVAPEVGQEVVLEVMGEMFPGILVASNEQGRHVRFEGEVDSERMAKILLRGVIEPAALVKEDAGG